MRKTSLILKYIFLFLYLLAILAFTFLGREPEPERQLWTTLFGSYHRAWDEQHDFIFWGIVANVVMTIPLGLLIPFGEKKVHFIRIMLLSAVFFLLIEVLQYITRLGYFDVDDIWNNLWGTAIGCGFYAGMMELVNGFHCRRRVNGLKVVAGMLPFGAFLLFFVYFLIRMGGGAA